MWAVLLISRGWIAIPSQYGVKKEQMKWFPPASPFTTTLSSLLPQVAMGGSHTHLFKTTCRFSRRLPCCFFLWLFLIFLVLESMFLLGFDNFSRLDYGKELAKSTILTVTRRCERISDLYLGGTSSFYMLLDLIY